MPSMLGASRGAGWVLVGGIGRIGFSVLSWFVPAKRQIPSRSQSIPFPGIRLGSGGGKSRVSKLDGPSGAADPTVGQAKKMNCPSRSRRIPLDASPCVYRAIIKERLVPMRNCPAQNAKVGQA